MLSSLALPLHRRVQRFLSTSALLLFASACGSDSGPTGSECDSLTSLEINGLFDVLFAGQSTQLSVTAQPSSCNPTVVWSASPGLTIDQDGTVSGDQVGGPFTIMAMAGGLTATGETSVATGPAVADSRWALAWLNDSTNPSYTISNNYHSSSRGAILVTRTGTGEYSLTFEGLAPSAGQRQNVQVSAYYTSAPARCRVLSVASQGTDLVVNVRCHSMSGAPADSRFDVLVAPAGSLLGRSAFAVSTSPEGGVVPAAMAHSSALLPIRVEKTSTGVYDVTFDGLSRSAVSGSGPEVPQVTPYGNGTAWCKVGRWAQAGSNLRVTVLCFTPTGTPADATFSILLLEKGRTGKRTAFVWADEATSAALYTPEIFYNFNSTGTPNQAILSSTGQYRVTWTGLVRGSGSTAETNLVTAYGENPNYCQVGSWGDDGTTFRCFDQNGDPANAEFNAIWIE